jgi:hypothetical protein
VAVTPAGDVSGKQLGVNCTEKVRRLFGNALSFCTGVCLAALRGGVGGDLWCVVNLGGRQIVGVSKAPAHGSVHQADWQLIVTF